ncbi:MAG: hypothetical protein ACREQ9_10170 [Candidatus Binatia bacterium]
MSRDVYDLTAPALRFSAPAEHGRGLGRSGRLVIVALAAVFVAAPLFLYSSLRRGAADARMKVVLHNTGVAMEGYGILHDSYVGASVPGLAEYGYRPTAGVGLAILRATIADFSLRACADGGSYPGLRFDSFSSSYRGETLGCH